ncbi:retrovirus-related pol polyprotein from transposon TNT 1-94, partial [Tanacetum coccineum]
YKADKEEEEKEEEKAEDDDEVTSDQKVSTPHDYELTEEDVNQEYDDTMGEDQEDGENGELYGDLNLNLDRQDAERKSKRGTQGKSKRASHPPKPVPNSKQRLHLLHMDLCGPMRIASINGKRYVLVIVDDYSRYTWVHFLRSKDEAPEVRLKCDQYGLITDTIFNL